MISEVQQSKSHTKKEVYCETSLWQMLLEVSLYEVTRHMCL
jgi:hypothetical protein